MAIPKNKTELILAIQDTYSKLKTDLIDLPLDLVNLVELEGHKKDSQMSIANLVAYLIGWGELVLKWNQLDKAGQTIDFPETGFKWTELGLLAQKFYKDYESENYPGLLDHLEKTVQQLLKLVENYDEQDLYQKPFYKTYPFGRMVQLNSSSPYKNARNRVRKWKKKRNLK